MDYLNIEFIELGEKGQVPCVTLLIEDKRRVFMVDSGSTYNLISFKCKHSFCEKRKVALNGVGRVEGKALIYERIPAKSKSTKAKVFLRNVVSMKKIFSRLNSFGIEGVLGTEFLVDNSALVDFKGKLLVVSR